MILDKIVEIRKIRIAEQKVKQPLYDLIDQLKTKEGEENHNKRDAFEKAIKEKKLSFICEVKRASPSKGIISKAFPYLDIAMQYQKAGATAISVLTEPDFFLGSNQYLDEISRHVTIPILRKDFIIDEYQIYEAKRIGADAVLLICALLNTEALRHFLNICKDIGLSALVEAHSEEDIESAINAGATIIGVNNRNLDTFEVDIHHCIRLRNRVPEGILYIAESGITDDEDIRLIKSSNIDAVLIGEALMKCKDIKGQIANWSKI